MKTNYLWVTDGGVQKFGPFDTERDAVICCEALNTAADWLSWRVVSTPGASQQQEGDE